MPDYKGKKPGFTDFIAALKQLSSARIVNNHQLFVVYGKSLWLVQEAVHTLRDTAKKAGLAIVSLEAKDINDGKLTDIFSQSSLFETSTLYLINKADQSKLLISRLAESGLCGMSNKIVLVMSGERIPAGLTKFLAAEPGVEAPCFAPWPNELPRAIEAFAGVEGLTIDSGGIQIILETVGNDLQKIKNELKRMSLHFGLLQKPLTRNDIAPFLGALKEDDIYQLDRYLLEKKYPLANSLLNNLIDRGEKPLSILAMLTNHCRNVLNVCDGLSKGFTPFEIGNRTRLPNFIMKTYLQSAKNVRVPSYTKALSACHRADRILKSSPVDEKLLLGLVVDAIADPGHVH